MSSVQVHSRANEVQTGGKKFAKGKLEIATFLEPPSQCVGTHLLVMYFWL
jgi:hypothetical protein